MLLYQIVVSTIHGKTKKTIFKTINLKTRPQHGVKIWPT